LPDLEGALSSLVSLTEGQANIIFLVNAEREIEVGVHEFEFGSKQRVVFDIYVAHLAEEESQFLKIEDVVDYEYLLDSLDQVIGAGRFGLVEQIADELLDYVLSPKQTLAATVKITKIEVPNAKGDLGCCLTRLKSQDGAGDGI
jgi:dihydroneopterin aldolase